MSDKTVIWAIDSSERRYVRVEDYEKIKAERDAAVKALTDVGVFLDHCWRDVQMNDFSFEWLERMIAAIDAAKEDK